MLNKTKHYTEQEFEELKLNNTNKKLEYINGTIYNISKPSLNHNKIKEKILYKLDDYLSYSQYYTVDENVEVILQDEKEINKLNPDIVVTCKLHNAKYEYIYSEPLIIYEIVSKYTSQHDRIVKYRIYEKFGVKEYNIVEQNGYIIQYKLNDGIYMVNNTFKGEDIYYSCIFEDLTINLRNIFY